MNLQILHLAYIFNRLLTSVAEADTDCWKLSESAKTILHRQIPDLKLNHIIRLLRSQTNTLRNSEHLIRRFLLCIIQAYCVSINFIICHITCTGGLVSESIFSLTPLLKQCANSVSSIFFLNYKIQGIPTQYEFTQYDPRSSTIHKQY